MYNLLWRQLSKKEQLSEDYSFCDLAVLLRSFTLIKYSPKAGPCIVMGHFHDVRILFTLNLMVIWLPIWLMFLGDFCMGLEHGCFWPCRRMVCGCRYTPRLTSSILNTRYDMSSSALVRRMILMLSVYVG